MPIPAEKRSRSVRRALLARAEIALLDVRQESRFATGHPLFAASFPLGHLEAQAAERLPRRAVSIVVYGDGADHAAAAARSLAALGYTDVSLLGRAAMTASWLAQMGWDAAVAEAGRAWPATGAVAPPSPPDVALAGGTQGWARSGRPLESGQGEMLSPTLDVYRRPYEGTGIDPAVMQAYLDWEYGLVGQLGRDGTHGFWVLTP
jgi:rhodanese-related sulfurtransferase